MRPTTATIHLGHLIHNYQLLQQRAGDSGLMAVVKADAYGHGLLRVAEALSGQGCRCFAVTDAAEGARLRSFLPKSEQLETKIFILSGFFDRSGAKCCQTYQLTPVVSDIAQLKWLYAVGFAGEVWLKVDTGMKRMGVAAVEPCLRYAKQHQLHIAGIMSHLACAETPEHPLNAQQMNQFQALQQTYPDLQFSLLNSAGVVAFSSAVQSTWVRPGIALYGVEPIPAMPLGLKPVMQLSANIIQIRPVQAGESVSYGATWQAEQAGDIAVVAMGYADGVSRLLSNHGEVMHPSGRLPIVGQVCMDYTLLAVDAAKVKLGDEVIFFGFAEGVPQVQAVAEQCQSIAYACLTSISARVPRQYIHASKELS